MGRFENEQKGLSENILGGVTTSRLEKNAVQPIICITNGKQMKTWKRQGFELTLRGMTSLVTRKRRRWKSDTMFRNDVEVHWDRYVAKLWKSCKQTRKTRWIIKPHLHTGMSTQFPAWLLFLNSLSESSFLNTYAVHSVILPQHGRWRVFSAIGFCCSLLAHNLHCGLSGMPDLWWILQCLCYL